MLIDLLSNSNYISFNIKLAQILGLHSAIYLSQIMDINEKALRKNKVTDNFFTLDRAYVESRTTFKEKEQKEIETTLIKLGVLTCDKENPDMIQLNIATLTSIMMAPDEELKKVAQTTKKHTTKSKQEVIADNLKMNIISVNPELRNAYCGWIDSVLTKDGFMTKQAVLSAQGTLDSFANRNLDVALAVLEIASINGYRDIKWAINTYNRDYKITYTVGSSSATPKSSSSSETTSGSVKKRLSDEVF